MVIIKYIFSIYRTKLKHERKSYRTEENPGIPLKLYNVDKIWSEWWLCEWFVCVQKWRWPRWFTSILRGRRNGAAIPDPVTGLRGVQRGDRWPSSVVIEDELVVVVDDDDVVFELLVSGASWFSISEATLFSDDDGERS